MVLIRYRDRDEKVDAAGLTISEARDQLKSKLGIPHQAQACLNGKKISATSEIDTILRQDDTLSFAVGKNRKTSIMIGATVLALIITGATFARGFINSTVSLGATVSSSNFADVVQNPDVNNITWKETGMTRSSIAGPHSIFNIVPANGYPGDLSLTVTLANADQLVKYYRNLDLKLQLVNTSDNSTVDINGDGLTNANDWVLLTLNNAIVTIPDPTAGNVTVRLLGGSYTSNPSGVSGGSLSPQLFCEVAQGAAAMAAQAPVASQVSYYCLNTSGLNSANFTRSLTPMSVTVGSASVSQSINQGGSVTLTINNAPGYADSGFYIYIGTLGSLAGLQVQASNGSGPFGANLWFDRDNNGDFFTWVNNVYQGTGSDAYILGPNSQNGALTINSNSQFTSLIPGGGNYTLAQLKSGAAPGINSNTKIAIWVGISVNSGNQNATIQSLSVSTIINQ